MLKDQGYDLAISLDHIHLVDEFLHINAPSAERLETSLSITCPERKMELDRASGRLRLHAVIGVRFLMFNGPAPERLSQADMDHAALSYGCASDSAVSSGTMSDKIPLGKHSTWSADEAEALRDSRMERSMLLEAVRASYALASSRMLQATGITPFGPIHMPLVDYDALLEQIENSDK